MEHPELDSIGQLYSYPINDSPVAPGLQVFTSGACNSRAGISKRCFYDLSGRMAYGLGW